MNKKIYQMVLAVSLLSLSLSSQAAFLIDDFSVETNYIFASENETSTLGISSDFSIERNLSGDIHPVSSSSDLLLFVDAADNGVLHIDTGVGTISDTSSRYSNSTGLNFRQAETTVSAWSDVFILTLLSIDQGGVEISLMVDGIKSSQHVNKVGDVLFLHSAFGDLSAVKSIDLLIHNNEAVDATFGSFISYGEASNIPSGNVPEPTLITLLAIGLTGLGFARRRS